VQATTDSPRAASDFPGQQRVMFAASQRETVIAELRDAREGERQHIADKRRGRSGSPIPAARERLLALDRALAQAESFTRPGKPFELVAPVWLVRSVVFDAGDYAVYLLGEAVTELARGEGSRRLVRQRFGAVQAWTATMLAVTRGEGSSHA